MPQEFVMSKQARMNGMRLPQPKADVRDFTLGELAKLCFTPAARAVHNWWMHRIEHHYLICADVEQERAREAQANVAYYQKRAALARSSRV